MLYVGLQGELVYSNDDREKVKASEMKAHELTVDVLSYTVLMGCRQRVCGYSASQPAVYLEASVFGRLPSTVVSFKLVYKDAQIWSILGRFT